MTSRQGLAFCVRAAQLYGSGERRIGRRLAHDSVLRGHYGVPGGANAVAVAH